MSFLTHDAIAIEQLVAEAAAPGCGGTCTFLGTVRNGPTEQGVTAIEYSAYDEMVDAELERVLAETRERWPAARVALRHRVGLVPVGAASIGIAVAAPHRAEAFAACRYVIEAVKERVPVWKKELRDDGTAVWVNPAGHSVPAGPR
ncbi:MAG TPA: molybdenum cofactor biosynthesis protein MoaE [Polyangiaceae bacterium]